MGSSLLCLEMPRMRMRACRGSRGFPRVNVTPGGGLVEIGGSSLAEVGYRRCARTVLRGRGWCVCGGLLWPRGGRWGNRSTCQGGPRAARLGSLGKAAAELQIEPRHLASPANAFSQSPPFLPARARRSVGGEYVKTFLKTTSFGGSGKRGAAQTPGHG